MMLRRMAFLAVGLAVTLAGGVAAEDQFAEDWSLVVVEEDFSQPAALVIIDSDEPASAAEPGYLGMRDESSQESLARTESTSFDVSALPNEAVYDYGEMSPPVSSGPQVASRWSDFEKSLIAHQAP